MISSALIPPPPPEIRKYPELREKAGKILHDTSASPTLGGHDAFSDVSCEPIINQVDQQQRKEDVFLSRDLFSIPTMSHHEGSVEARERQKRQIAGYSLAEDVVCCPGLACLRCCSATKTSNNADKIFCRAEKFRVGDAEGGIEKDEKKAFELYQEAHEKGSVKATYKLGVFYQYGVAGDRDLHEAALKYKTAADCGHPRAIRNLGILYYYGMGVEQSQKKAVDHWDRAAAKGDLDAFRQLAKYYRENSSMGSKAELVEMYARKALELDPTHPTAALELAETLVSSFEKKKFEEAAKLASMIPQGSNPAYIRAQWLLTFIRALDEDDVLRVSCQGLEDDFIPRADIQLVAKIGEGHFGDVYLARFRQNKTERNVAVKYLRFDLVLERPDVVEHVQFERLFWRIVRNSSEAKHGMAQYIGYIDSFSNTRRGLVFELCADLNGVESLDAESMRSEHFIPVRFQDLSTVPDRSRLVRSSLRSCVVHTQRPPVSTVVRMLAKAARALKGLHRLGIIHRDIADRNVLCDGHGNVQLTDLGLAKYLEFANDTAELGRYRLNLTEGHQYSIAWWAPECVGTEMIGSIFSTNSDVYSFGILMWQCFSHKDPFYYIKMDEEAAWKIGCRIHDGERPSLDENILDGDTPPELVQLMEDCWQTDPRKRPDLTKIIAVLERAADPSAFRRNPDKRRVRNVAEKWFDVQSMYLAYHSIAEDAVGSFSYCEQRAANVQHKIAPSLSLDSGIVDSIGDSPFDVFLVHTGAQKQIAVASMQAELEKGGFRCFLDCRMENRDGAPAARMRFSLETCRYCVALVSKAFLKRKDPVDELKYAVARMQWLRLHYGIKPPLWIVLFDLTLHEFTAKWQRITHVGNSCSNIGDEVTMLSWPGAGKQALWPNWIRYSLKNKMYEYDTMENGVEKWTRFLRELNQRDDFPGADALYTEH